MFTEKKIAEKFFSAVQFESARKVSCFQGTYTIVSENTRKHTILSLTLLTSGLHHLLEHIKLLSNVAVKK